MYVPSITCKLQHGSINRLETSSWGGLDALWRAQRFTAFLISPDAVWSIDQRDGEYRNDIFVKKKCLKQLLVI